MLKMNMLSKRSNETLRRTASMADPEWFRYAAYCRAREAGLRRSAFDHLAVFLRSIKDGQAQQRRNFANWICERVFEAGADADALLPEPLLRQLVLPTLNEWTLQEPHKGVPLRWLGILRTSRSYAGLRCGLSAPDEEAIEMLEAALRLDPQDQMARIRLLECYIGTLEYHAHHLPESYLGEPDADLRTVEAADSLISGLRDAEQQSRLHNELKTAREVLLDWIDARAAKIDFQLWRSRHGRAFSPVTRVYVYDPQKPSE